MKLTFQLVIDDVLVEGARASAAYSFAKKSDTLVRAASTSYVDEVLKGKTKTYTQELLSSLSVST
jgi:hypothetical protein